MPRADVQVRLFSTRLFLFSFSRHLHPLSPSLPSPRILSPGACCSLLGGGCCSSSWRGGGCSPPCPGGICYAPLPGCPLPSPTWSRRRLLLPLPSVGAWRQRRRLLPSRRGGSSCPPLPDIVLTVAPTLPSRHGDGGCGGCFPPPAWW